MSDPPAVPNDTLIGGLGDDSLKGGTEADIFRFSSNDGNDVIKDFKVSQGDKLQLMKSENDSSDLTYSAQGNHTVITWHDLTITVNNIQDQDQIAQHIEWMMIG